MSTTLPGVYVTIPGLNPQDTLGSAILNALNSIIGTQGGQGLSEANYEFPGSDILYIPTVSGGTIIGDVSVNGILFEPHYVQDLVIKSPDGNPGTPLQGQVTVISNANNGQSIVSGQYTDLSLYVTGGTGTVNSGGGYNQFYTPTVSGLPGEAGLAWFFDATTGENTVGSYNGNNTIAMGNGDNEITVGGGTASIISSGSDDIAVTGGAATINVVPGGSDNVTASATGSLYFVSESATDSTVEGGNTTGDYINGGTAPGGGGIFAGGSGGNNTLISGYGSSTLIGGGGNDQLSLQGTGRDVVTLGSGSETVNAANFHGSDTVYSPQASAPGGNSDLITGSTGNDTFVMSGNVSASIYGNGGADVYDIVKSYGPQNITIEDWTASDSMSISGYAPYTPSASFTAIAGGYQATLGDGSVITLNTNVSPLNTQNIKFG